MNGTVVVGFIFVVAALALVMVASANKKPRSGADIDKSPNASKAKVSKRASSVTMKDGCSEDDEEVKRASALIVPPPDEKRIEAIAPRNDRGAFRGYTK